MTTLAQDLGGVVRLLEKFNAGAFSHQERIDFEYACVEFIRTHSAEIAGALRDAERLDYIERTFSGMTNRERYLPVQMIWGKGANGRTLREACDKYMQRESAMQQGGGCE